MLYRTHFQRVQIGIATIREWNYPLAVLCQDLGLFTLLAAVLWIEEGGWWGVPFQAFWSFWVEYHARLVQGLCELASLSSKSTCNLCVAFGVQGAVLASAFLCPVCSISWLGSSREEGPIPIGELEKIDLMFVCKVGNICWLKLKQVRCRM